jgi:hypothetical protein
MSLKIADANRPRMISGSEFAIAVCDELLELLGTCSVLREEIAAGED